MAVKYFLLITSIIWPVSQRMKFSIPFYYDRNLLYSQILSRDLLKVRLQDSIIDSHVLVWSTSQTTSSKQSAQPQISIDSLSSVSSSFDYLTALSASRKGLCLRLHLPNHDDPETKTTPKTCKTLQISRGNHSAMKHSYRYTVKMKAIADIIRLTNGNFWYLLNRLHGIVIGPEFGFHASWNVDYASLSWSSCSKICVLFCEASWEICKYIVIIVYADYERENDMKLREWHETERFGIQVLCYMLPS